MPALSEASQEAPGGSPQQAHRTTHRPVLPLPRDLQHTFMTCVALSHTERYLQADEIQ